MNVFARLLAPLSIRATEARRENLSVAEANRLQEERLLRDELNAQWDIYFQSTFPYERDQALDEIDRINTLLRAI